MWFVVDCWMFTWELVSGVMSGQSRGNVCVCVCVCVCVRICVCVPSLIFHWWSSVKAKYFSHFNVICYVQRKTPIEVCESVYRNTVSKQNQP